MSVGAGGAGARVRFGVILEAWKWRFAKPNDWLGVTLLAWLVYLALAGPAHLVARHIERSTGNLSGHAALLGLMFVPLWGCCSAFLWAIDACVYYAALRQLRSEPFKLNLLFSNLRLFPRLILPALGAQLAYAGIVNLAMVWVRWSVVYWVGVATEPLLAGPFLFVLPLMVDRELGFRQATRLSLQATGVRAPLYAVLNWILQAVVFAVPVVLACTLGCLGPFVAIVLMVAAIPTPYIAVALLYRDRFPQETTNNQQLTTNNQQPTTCATRRRNSAIISTGIGAMIDVGQLKAKRLAKWHLDGKSRIPGSSEAVQFIEEMGVCTLFAASPEFPNLYQAHMGDANAKTQASWDSPTGHVYTWRWEIGKPHSAFYAAIVAGKPTWVSWATLPHMLAARMEMRTPDELYDSGLISERAYKLACAFDDTEGVLSTRELRNRAGFPSGKENRAQYLKALGELESLLLVANRFSDQGDDDMSHVLVDYHYREIAEEARRIGPEAGLAGLLERYLPAAVYIEPKAFARHLRLQPAALDAAVSSLVSAGKAVPAHGLVVDSNSI